MAGLEQMLVELEREGWEALVAGRGGEYYREHLQPTRGSRPVGVMSRDDAIAAMESAQPWSTFEIKDPQVVALTEDCGVVVYLAAAQRAGDEPYSAVVSSTFVRRGGAWKLAFHHQAHA